MSNIEATLLSVGYGNRLVLDGLNFVAKAGEVTAIVGPNGSGKSTLLKALCRDLPYRGTVTINGRDMDKLRLWELAAIRGVLPQASRLAFPYTAIEVVQIGLHAGAAATDPGLPHHALAKVGLETYANRFYQELSGGEQQRVQLARVLAQVWEPMSTDGPRWLFLDEPVASLDIAHQLQIMEIARAFADQGGGVVIVMHDLNLTAQFADRVVVLSQGRSLANDTPSAVMTDQILSMAYGCNIAVNRIPPPGQPFVLPPVRNPFNADQRRSR
ncbi:MAG: heme ABC transporter ATP-binding protein [Pseudomonadota bacterium]